MNTFENGENISKVPLQAPVLLLLMINPAVSIKHATANVNKIGRYHRIMAYSLKLQAPEAKQIQSLVEVSNLQSLKRARQIETPNIQM